MMETLRPYWPGRSIPGAIARRTRAHRIDGNDARTIRALASVGAFAARYSTGVKAKGSDNMAGNVVGYGLNNMADGDNSLLESLTLEAIVEADPDYIFVVTMGKDDEKTMAALAESLTDNPAWAGLTAVREGRYVRLDKMLFHYKPNARWAESYAFLYALLYDDETG